MFEWLEKYGDQIIITLFGCMLAAITVFAWILLIAFIVTVL